LIRDLRTYADFINHNQPEHQNHDQYTQTIRPDPAAFGAA
jgi:hypothetical protein